MNGLKSCSVENTINNITCMKLTESFPKMKRLILMCGLFILSVQRVLQPAPRSKAARRRRALKKDASAREKGQAAVGRTVGSQRLLADARCAGAAPHCFVQPSLPIVIYLWVVKGTIW